jgi:hypothetical protein
MRFSYASWGTPAPEGAAACDGLVPRARLDLSHWAHNRTPRHLKADTSVEIALNFIKERDRHDVEVVANNHFDTDGVLAVWTLVRPEIATAHAELIVSAAESGDFDEWPKDERGLMLEAAISKLGSQGLNDRRAYERVLPLLDEIVPAISSREDLWGESLEALRAAAADVVSIDRVGRIAVFSCKKEPAGAWLHRLAPEGTDRWLIAVDGRGGHRYSYELPRYAWADTVSRPKLAMPRRGPIRRRLGPEWIIKGRRGMTGIAFTQIAVPDPPRAVAAALADLESASEPAHAA